jgi:hypothetical protein
MNARTIALIVGPLILALAAVFQLVLMGLGATLLVRKRKSSEPFARSLLYLSSPLALLAGVMGERREERRAQPKETPEICCPWCGEPLQVQGGAGIVDRDGQWEAQTDVYVCSNGHEVFVADGERERENSLTESPFAVAIAIEDGDLERYQQAVIRLCQIGEATETASGGQLRVLDEESADLWRELGEAFTAHLADAGLVEPLVPSTERQRTGDDR